MTNRTRIGLGVILLLMIVSFCAGRCSKTCKTQTLNIPVVIPEKRGEFQSPSVLVPIESKEITKIVYHDSIITVPTVNQDLMDKYISTLEENDKLKNIQQYADAIRINKYKQTYEDPNIKIDIEAETEGKLLSLKPNYVWKSQKINVPIEIPQPKERVFSMNIGAGLNTTKQLDKLEPTVNLDLVNKKGNTLSIGYGTEGTISANYKIKLFDIKK